MPFYKPKDYRVEFVELTSNNINSVYAWVNQSPMCNAHSLTETSFVINYLDNTPDTALVGYYVVRRSNNAFTAIPAEKVGERWEAIPEDQVLSFPTLNQMLDETANDWVRFSELVF